MAGTETPCLGFLSAPRGKTEKTHSLNAMRRVFKQTQEKPSSPSQGHFQSRHVGTFDLGLVLSGKWTGGKLTRFTRDLRLRTLSDIPCF